MQAARGPGVTTHAGGRRTASVALRPDAAGRGFAARVPARLRPVAARGAETPLTRRRASAHSSTARLCPVATRGTETPRA